MKLSALRLPTHESAARADVYYSACRGRPPLSVPSWYPRASGAPKYSVTWCAWTTPPELEPLTLPCAYGGAPTRADVPELVRRGRHHADTYLELPARFAQQWRAWSGDSAADRLFEETLRRLRAAAKAGDAGQRAHWHTGPRVEEISFGRPPARRDGPPPPWALLLGLSWPDFTELDVKAAWRARAFAAHPDRNRGGSHEAFIAIGAARDAALAHLGAS